MGKELAKSEQKQPRYRIAAGSFTPGASALEDSVANARSLSISLKHYQDSHECFSSWKPSDLKRFSSTIRKIREMSREDLNTTNIISKISNQNGWRLKKPLAVDKELPIFELRMAKSNRAFGVMRENVFYLIWLDRNHAIL